MIHIIMWPISIYFSVALFKNANQLACPFYVLCVKFPILRLLSVG